MATLRLSYVSGYDDGDIFRYQPVVEIVCSTTGKESLVSAHMLDWYLGNHDLRIMTHGIDFSLSSRNIRLSSGTLTVDLGDSFGGWVPASIAVRPKCIHTTETWTHELLIENSNPLGPEIVVPPTFLELGMACWNLRLEGASSLKADCHPIDMGNACWNLELESGALSQDDICKQCPNESAMFLDSLLGNSNGSFNFMVRGFSASARNVHLRNAVLHAELLTDSQEWQTDQIDLRRIVCNHGEGLQPAYQPRFLRVSRPLLVGPTSAEESADPLYTPLDSERAAFRLCFIEPGEWDDPVECRMTTRRIDDMDEYLCLSYAWGTENELATIQVNSHTKRVTRNLYSAMRRLRWHGYFGALWIDAICINQMDDEEKSVQVSLMANTYAKAQRVFVWLESFEYVVQADREIMTAMIAAFFGHLAYNAHVHDAIGNAIASAVQLAGARLKALTDPSIAIEYFLKALRTFSSSPWFERTWTVQEYTLSQDLVYGFGHELIAGKALRLAIVRLDCHLQTCCKSSLHDFGGKSRADLSAQFTALQRLMANLINVRDLSNRTRELSVSLSNRQASPYQSIDSAIVLLAACRVKQCSDPRDRIFAFTNIASQALGSFKVDYTRSAQNLYKAFTRAIVDQVGNFDIWSLAQPPSTSAGAGLPGLPSWTIDWTISHDIDVRLDFYLRKYNTIVFPEPITLPGDLYEQISEDVLAVRGTRFDAINAVTTETWSIFDRGNGQDEVMATSKLQSWLQFLNLDGPKNKANQPLLWDSFCGMMLADQFALFSNAQGDLVNLPGSNLQKIWRPAHQDDRAEFDIWAAVEQERTSVESPVMAFPDNMRVMRQLVDGIAGQKKLFTTRGGRIGLCPAWVGPGDELFHVSGSRWPVVLRERSMTFDPISASATYELVGTCYVRGITEELVNDALCQAIRIHIS